MIHPTLLAWQQHLSDELVTPPVSAEGQDARWAELSALVHTTLSQIQEAARVQVQPPSQRVQPLPLGLLAQHLTEQRFLIAAEAVAASIRPLLAE